MPKTDVLHGALVFFRKDGRAVALGKDPRVRLNSPLAPVEPVGQPHPEEYLRTGSEVDLEFAIYRKDNNSITKQGFFPSQTDARAFVEHPEMTIQIESRSGTILHRIKGFKVESVDVGYSKGEPSMYQISGKGTQHFDEADIN